MKRSMLAGFVVLGLSLLLSEAQGDMIGPKRPGFRPVRPIVPPGGGVQPNPLKVKLVVKVDEKAKQAVLQVPMNLAMGQLHDGNVGQAPEAQPEDGRRFGLATVIAGLSLTLAFASGGLWLARRGSSRTVAILLVVSVFAAGTAAVWADLGPHAAGPRPRPAPPAKPALTTLKLPAGVELSDSLILQPMPAGNYLTLIVPKKMVSEKEKDGKDKEATPPEKRAR